MEIIARKKEKQVLADIFHSNSAELAAVYGRRRVGKTYLVRNYFESLENVVYFELTGQKQESGEYAPLKFQLANFKYQFERTFGKEIPRPSSWQEAFAHLRRETERFEESGKRLVLFFDELPWLCSP